ncbi:MAG: helix-turn-helix domain-containing protein [SAR324 cluster bacterium]|nr:helix-turn-helix domain-containing protein [SAR324 cluster bacterium]
MTEDKYRVLAVEKALEVLEYLSKRNHEISFTALCNELGKTTSEMFRVIETLAQRGYISKIEKSNSIKLTSKIFRLAQYHPPFRNLIEAASGPMAEYSQKMGLSCHISILENGNSLNLYAQEGANEHLIHAKTGAYFPAIERNSGRTLISLLKESEFYAFLENDPTFQAYDEIKKEKTIKKLKSYRKKPYTITPSFVFPGVSTVVVPLQRTKSGLQATLSGGFFKSMVEINTLIKVMLETAHQINQRWATED